MNYPRFANKQEYNVMGNIDLPCCYTGKVTNPLEFFVEKEEIKRPPK